MEHKGKILIVEDDKNTGFLLKKRLQEEGFNALLCTNGKEAEKIILSQNLSLCILDIMIPSKDGLELSKDIRMKNNQVPIIFLTARNLKSDIVQGYKNGCDDYLTKPFDIDELMLKIHAIIRRTGTRHIESGELKVSKLSLLREEHVLVSENKRMNISHKEMLILELFFRNFNQVVTRRSILIACWGNDDYFSSNILNVYLTKIRKLIKADGSLVLHNIHGHGYKLTKK